jgi:hypothetical protein
VDEIPDRLVLFTSDRPRHLFTRSITNNKPEIEGAVRENSRD